MSKDTNKKHTIHSVNGIQYLNIRAFEMAGAIQHAFTTRKGGLGDRDGRFKETREWASIADVLCIAPEKLVTLNQVHGSSILHVDGQNYSHLKTLQGDAMITSSRGLAIGVETADCVPILLFDPVAPAVAAVHAGWRGTVTKIAQKTVLSMKQSFNTEPARLIAAIGPAIGPECYEVDEPVMELIRNAFPYWQKIATARSLERWSLNLVMANTIELANIGLNRKNIHTLDMCTSCRNDLFYSFRHEGRTGRMLSVIALKSGNESCRF